MPSSDTAVTEPTLDIPSVLEIGEGSKLKSNEEITLTKETAIEMLSLETFSQERPVSGARAAQYAELMREKTFNWDIVTLCVAKCSEDKKTYRVNGGHTCSAVASMQDDFEVKTRLLTYLCKTVEDVRILYSQFDQNFVRTKQHVTRVILAGDEEFDKLPQSVVRKLIGGYQIFRWANPKERTEHAGHDVAALIRTNDYALTLKVAKFLADLDPSDHKHLLRAPTVAAMLATVDLLPRKALSKFWEPVAFGTGIRGKNDPRLKLRDLLQTTSVASSDMAPGKVMSREKMYRICIVAWNYYCAGKPMPSIPRIKEDDERPAIESQMSGKK